jgi:hypothetical protein
MMSQIIACKNENGIILACDSQAVDFDLQDKMVTYSIKRLHQLTPATAIITGGSAAGQKMCETFKDFIAGENLTDIEDVYKAALPFLASEYESFMKKTCEYLPIDPINQVHFIIGGYSAKAKNNPFKLYLLWTKKKLPLLDGDEISTAYSIPRLIMLEYQLNRLCQKNENLNKIRSRIRTHFTKQSKINPEICGPFSFASITHDGFQAVP